MNIEDDVVALIAIFEQRCREQHTRPLQAVDKSSMANTELQRFTKLLRAIFRSEDKILQSYCTGILAPTSAAYSVAEEYANNALPKRTALLRIASLRKEAYSFFEQHGYDPAVECELIFRKPKQDGCDDKLSDALVRADELIKRYGNS